MTVKLSDRMSPHESVTYFFEQAADRIRLDDEMRDVLRGSYREMQVQVPVRMDDGQAPGLQRLPRPAQRGPRAVQGRRPLPPRGAISTRCARWPRS